MRHPTRLAALLILAGMVFLCSCLPPEKEVKGKVRGEVVIEPGRYVIKSTLYIEPGAKFVVPAGSEVRLAKGGKIIVEGAFVIRAQATKRVTFKIENFDGFFVGPGFSGEPTLVTDAYLRLENCDFLGDWNGALVTGRSSTVVIAKSTFTSAGTRLLNTEGCSVVFEANRILNREISERDIRAQGASSVRFVANEFAGCSFTRDSVLLDGRDQLVFDDNAFDHCRFYAGERNIVLGKFGSVRMIGNRVVRCAFSSDCIGFLVDSYSLFTMARNRFLHNEASGSGALLVRARARTASIYGNYFESNKGCSFLAAAGNDVSFENNWVRYNSRTPLLLSFWGRKGDRPSHLDLLNCRFRRNAPGSWIGVNAFALAEVRKNVFAPAEPVADAGPFVVATGNKEFRFHFNHCEKVNSPEFIRCRVEERLEASWVDPGNLVPKTELFTVAVTQNDILRSRVRLVAAGVAPGKPGVFWRITTNYFYHCDMASFLPYTDGPVGAVVRDNRFKEIPEILFSQSGKGSRTVIDMNLFKGCPKLVFKSGTSNPRVDFRLVSNSFESRGMGFTVKKEGEIYMDGNYFNDAVMFE